MASWVVSAHGLSIGREVHGRRNVHRLVRLPHGVRFYFFENEGVSLAVDKAWGIYDLVMKNQPSSDTYRQIAATPGYTKFEEPALPDYYITGDNSWIDKHGQLASGIFKMHDEFHKDPMTFRLRQGDNYFLSAFFDDDQITWKPGDQVFWLACRSWA